MCWEGIRNISLPLSFFTFLHPWVTCTYINTRTLSRDTYTFCTWHQRNVTSFIISRETHFTFHTYLLSSQHFTKFISQQLQVKAVSIDFASPDKTAHRSARFFNRFEWLFWRVVILVSSALSLTWSAIPIVFLLFSLIWGVVLKRKKNCRFYAGKYWKIRVALLREKMTQCCLSKAFSLWCLCLIATHEKPLTLFESNLLLKKIRFVIYVRVWHHKTLLKSFYLFS